MSPGFVDLVVLLQQNRHRCSPIRSYVRFWSALLSSSSSSLKCATDNIDGISVFVVWRGALVRCATERLVILRVRSFDGDVHAECRAQCRVKWKTGAGRVRETRRERWRWFWVEKVPMVSVEEEVVVRKHTAGWRNIMLLAQYRNQPHHTDIICAKLKAVKRVVSSDDDDINANKRGARQTTTAVQSSRIIPCCANGNNILVRRRTSRDII